MTFLITIWILSFISIAAAVTLAYRGYSSEKSQRYIIKGIPISTWDLFIVTYKDFLHVITDRWHDVLPYIHNATTYVLTRFISYRDRAYAKVFGYHAVPQGGVVSFFLKRIIAHKEEFNQKVAHRRSLHEAVPVKKKKENYFEGLKGELRELE